MIIYGRNPIIEAIKAKRTIYHLYLQKGIVDQYLTDLLSKYKLSFEYKPKDFLSSLSGTSAHLQVVADVEEYKEYSLPDYLKENSRIRIAILDEINDPHNLGAVIRSAECFKVDAIMYQRSHSAGVNSTVVKTSSGAIEYVKLIVVDNLLKSLELLREKQVTILGASLKGSDLDKEKKYDSNCLAICFGSEGFGLRPLVERLCTSLVKIPMSGTLDSLNISVAAGILFFELFNNKD